MDTIRQTQTNTIVLEHGPLARLESLLKTKPVILQLLKFGAIGVINAALDFLILNVLSKFFDVTVGTSLGLINVASFSVAVIQSYAWNKAWAFGDSDTSPIKNFLHLCVIGGLGSLGVILVLVGAQVSATALYYFLLLAAFIVAEIAIWKSFSLSLPDTSQQRNQFASFIAVSIGGLIINSGVVALGSDFLLRYVDFLGNEDMVKNVAKIAATGVSLVWNFIGYKIIVFKK